MTTPGSPPVVAAELASVVAERVEGGARFAGLFASADGDATRLVAALAWPGRLEAVEARLGPDERRYPSLAASVPSAGWYEREIRDLFGVVADGHPRLDPLVLPQRDPHRPRPRPGSGSAVAAVEPDEAALPAHVVGEGMFTIPYGPVRSGVFEAVEYLVETPGEDIVHLRTRVFHKHRGIERRFEDLSPTDGVLLAERVEGIASVAHSVAYCAALERLAQIGPPVRAALVRVIHAELERVANHLDVAVRLAEAAGLAVAYARFSVHKERTLRLVAALCGSRFGRGVVIPGGVTGLPALGADALRVALGPLERDLRADAQLLMATPSFLDRIRATGPLAPEHAAALGALGPVGRASGLDEDIRAARPYDAYDRLGFQGPQARSGGDAQARLQVRWDEVWGSFHLVRQAVDELAGLGQGPLSTPVEAGDGAAFGWAEAPQGEVLYLVEVADGRLRRVKPRSASFHNLSLFHHVFQGDILTDFAFIEASFGLSIAGVSG